MYCCTDFLLFVLVLVLVTNFSESATKKVIVSRCCKNGNSIEKIEGQTMCYPGATTEWNPRIYSLRKKVFLNVIPGSWNIAEGNMPDCGRNKKPILLKENSYLLLESGMLFYENTKITPDRFCSDIQQALVCLDNIEDHQETLSQIPQVTIQKCCGTKAVYNHKESKCIVWNTTVNIELNSESKNITFNLISGFPNCHNDTGNFDIAGSFDKFTLQDDGSLTEGVTSWEQSSYCLEHFSESTTDPPNVLVCPRGIRIVAEERFDLKYILYPIGLLISAVFLAATLATSFLLPSSHHLLHWRCQTNHVACLLVADVLLAISQLAGHQIRGVPCSLLAITMHFFFLAAFFWLNTMCFNIWWTFRDLRPASLEKGQEACRLRLYEAYAWGGSLIIAGVAAILDQLPEDPSYAFLRPRFGQRNCWFYGDMEILTYFYGPIGVLLLTNLVLFILTARELTCGLWKREVVKSTTERAALGRVCLKLVVVMGVSWIADILSWAAGGAQELWYLTDVINTLQGLFIFIVIGCQPQVWAAVKRIWCVHQNHTSGATGNGNHHSSSSHGLPSLGDSITNNTLTNMTNATNISVSSKIPLETSC